MGYTPLNQQTVVADDPAEDIPINTDRSLSGSNAKLAFVIYNPSATVTVYLRWDGDDPDLFPVAPGTRVRYYDMDMATRTYQLFAASAVSCEVVVEIQGVP